MFSVLIPTFNPRPEHLRQALERLRAQTETRWQALVHDDASNVDVRAMVEPYLSDPRMTFRHSEKRLGIGGNWNACVAQSQEPIVAFLFQDDWWEPEYLERALAVFRKHEDIGIAALAHHYAIEDDIVTAQEYRELEELRKRELTPGRQEGRAFLEQWVERGLRPNIIGEPDFVVMRRSLIEETGAFHEEMPQSLDAEYWVRALRHTNWYFVPELCGTFRVHSEGATAQNREQGQGLFDRFRMLQQYIDALPSGERKRAALRAQVKQFQEMAQKYRGKRDRGDTITLRGAGALKRFCLRHPLVALHTLWQVQRKNASKA